MSAWWAVSTQAGDDAGQAQQRVSAAVLPCGSVATVVDAPRPVSASPTLHGMIWTLWLLLVGFGRAHAVAPWQVLRHRRRSARPPSVSQLPRHEPRIHRCPGTSRARARVVGGGCSCLDGTRAACRGARARPHALSGRLLTVPVVPWLVCGLGSRSTNAKWHTRRSLLASVPAHEPPRRPIIAARRAASSSNDASGPPAFRAALPALQSRLLQATVPGRTLHFKTCDETTKSVC